MFNRKIYFKYTLIFTEKKSIRRSTAAKSAETLKRMKERAEDQRKKPKMVKHDDYKPTQEELLKEALETEKINLKSLGTSLQELNGNFYVKMQFFCL